MSMIHLDTPVEELFLVGPIMGGKLKKLGITTIEDLLRHVPFRYEDFRIISKIDKLQEGEVATVHGTIDSIKNVYTRNRRTFQEAIVKDQTGTIKVMWFNQPFLLNALKVGSLVSLSGKTKRFGARLSIDSPVYELLKEESSDRVLATIHTGRLVPVYPETYGVSSKWLRSRIKTALKLVGNQIIDFLPTEIIRRNDLFDEKHAIFQIHFPDSEDTEIKARKRLSFDELFLIQLASQLKKQTQKKEKVKKIFKVDKYKKEVEKFIQSLPFTLTNAQKKAILEIQEDLKENTPMNRLLQGEVGSGKTVVATIAIYIAHLNGTESVLMAPTEILANQHYKTLSELLLPMGIKVSLFTRKEKQETSTVIVGTHAVLQKSLKLKKVGLIIIDEQQRFGVSQRGVLGKKGKNPHLLTMTATPIPRTLALALYGELDVSYINELPKERKIVKTWVVPNEKRQSAYKWITEKLKETKSQAYIICPFIEESESMTTVKAAKSEYEKLKNVFPSLSLGLLHGKLKTTERNQILEEFKSGKIDVLVATPIVEVGIDVPNATIMLIEAGDRFGLTQLHQLRGRVGRGAKQGYCLLFTENESTNSIERLKIMETNFIGANIAEKDLKRRGPGDMYGLKQHGFTDARLKVATFEDEVLVKNAKDEAHTLIENPTLIEKSSHLQEKLKKYTIEDVTSN